MEVGVSQPVGFRWFREAGGMAPSHLSRSSGPPSGRYRSFSESELSGCGMSATATVQILTICKYSANWHLSTVAIFCIGVSW